jgi:excisionase family DNA binding protein
MSQSVTASELADELRISIKTVYRMAQDGEIPAERYRRTWRFDIDQVRTARQHEPVNLWAKPSRKRRI